MDIKAFPALIVGVVVALVLAGAVLPVFAETTSATDTFTNEGGLIYATPITEDTDVTINWDYTAPSQLTVNDVDIEIPTGAYPITFAFSKSWLVRIQPGDSGVIQVYDDQNVSTTISATVANSTNMNIVITGSSVTFTAGENTKTYPVDGGLVISPTGDYILKKSTDKAYFSENSTAYIAGYSFHAINNTGAIIGIYSYTLNDGITDWGLYPPTTTHTDTINKTAITNYVSLNELSSIVMEVSDGTNTGTITYNQFFVPVEVTAEKSVHPDGPLTVILNVLPLLAVAGLVTGAVVWFINRKG